VRLATGLLALSSACTSAPASREAPRQPAPANMLMHDVDSILASYDHADTPGASVVVIRNGEVVLRRNYGLADLETRAPVTEHTNFRLASLTKQFTATAILLLVRQGKLGLDDPVSELLPNLPAHARGVTVRELLTHTSGLWAYEDFVPDTQTYQVKDRDVPALLAHADSTYFRPGSVFRYSNTGYALLALIVERLSGLSFATFLHDRIFAPLGMDSTVAYENGISTVPQRAFGYSGNRDRFRRTDQSSTSAVLGDGGIYTSTHDLIAWNRALDEHKLLDPDTQRLAWTQAILTDGTRAPYGFGWWIERDAFGVKLWHNGETRGFTNGIVKYPERRITVIVLTNRTGGEPWLLASKIAHLKELVEAAKE
jgi:CubicO group peptidase (beta-lactamase class C family)